MTKTLQTAARRAGLRSWLASLTIMLIVLVLSLAGVEVALRVFDLAPADGVGTVTEREFRRVPGIYAPGQHLVDRRIPALAHEVNINALGYRGKDFPIEKDAGETRILVIGDSFVYGDFVDDDETLPALLSLEVAAKCQNVRFINAGLGGSTITEHAQLASRALQLHPDLMILVASENDVSDLAQPATMWQQLANNRAAKSRFPLSIAYPILRNTALWNLALKVRGNLSNREVKRNIETAQTTTPKQPAVQQKAATLVPGDFADQYRAELISLQRVASDNRIPFFFAAYPSHLTLLGTRSPELMQWFLETARNAGIPTTDFSPALHQAGRPIPELYLLPHDGHPSPAGYGAAARMIADTIRAQLRQTDRCAS